MINKLMEIPCINRVILCYLILLLGILAQNTDAYMNKTFGPTYIVASYIKYIESAGGRVAPIRYPFKQVMLKSSCYLRKHTLWELLAFGYLLFNSVEFPSSINGSLRHCGGTPV